MKLVFRNLENHREEHRKEPIVVTGLMLFEDDVLDCDIRSKNT